MRTTIGSRPDISSVQRAIAHAAERTGADFSYLLNQAKAESGLNPTARAGNSSAAGLFQFIDQSWLGVLKQHGAEHGYGWAADAIRHNGRGWTVSADARQAVFALRNDPTASALMAGEYASDNEAGLEQALGRDATAGDLYFAHFLGLAGAKRFLKAAEQAPGASAAALFPREAAANRSIFYGRGGEARSMAQVYALMATKVSGAASPPPASGTPRLDVDPDVLMADGERLTREPPTAVRLAALDPSAAQSGLAEAQDPTALDLMKPRPEQARLAYMLVLSTLNA